MKSISKDSSRWEFQRKACDLAGNLGSLYDARTDRFVKHHPLVRDSNSSLGKSAIASDWWQVNNDHEQSEILYSRLGMQDELCLNLYLRKASAELQGRAHLINFDPPIGPQTFFFTYTYTRHKQSLPEHTLLALSYFPDGTFSTLDVEATHIVLGIEWGFEVLFCIQIPPHHRDLINRRAVTGLLEKIRYKLQQQSAADLEFTTDEQKLWSQLNTHVRGTSPLLNFDETTHLMPTLFRIRRFQDSPPQHEYPLEYTFRPIKWLYQDSHELPCVFFDDQHSQYSRMIQRELYLLKRHWNNLAASLQSLQNLDEAKHLPVQFASIGEQYHQLESERDALLQRLSSLFMDVRQGRQKLHVLLEVIEEYNFSPCRKSIPEDFLQQCHLLAEKARLVGHLRNYHFEYLQLTNDGNCTTEERIRKLFINITQPIGVFCSSDAFLVHDGQCWKSCQDNLIMQRNHNPDLRLIYADLSYCIHNDLQTSRTFRLDPRPLTVINVLLIGESGVGKSTFINAFVNYLLFDTLDEAEAGEPAVLIPVSFLTTVGHNFDEIVVKFGDTDVNESYDTPGQSVTQQCRSYLFDISAEVQFRIIDTPGIGDTRGLEQDEKNIDQILSYVTHFGHINAICILLKPNTTRLHIVFRSCMTQLFTYLAPSAVDNIIFCFTNTRSTFFGPGNTAPILKSFLKELPTGSVPFSSKNSFCFDSESFRHLMLVKNELDFNEYQRGECLKSWTNSVKESERLFNCIRSLKPYSIDQWRSEKHAQLQIRRMLRPIMETFLVSLHNFILQEHQRNLSLGLVVTAILDSHSSRALCHNCGFTVISFEHCYVAQYTPHEIDGASTDANPSCATCQCELVKHQTIEYQLTYSSVPVTDREKLITYEDMNLWLNLFATFARFLGSGEIFLDYLEHFANVQNTLKTGQHLSINGVAVVNKHIHDELLHIKCILQKSLQSKDTAHQVKLDRVYEWLHWAKSFPMVQKQYEAIQARSRSILISQQRFIARPIQCTGMLTRLAQWRHRSRYGMTGNFARLTTSSTCVC